MDAFQTVDAFRPLPQAGRPVHAPRRAVPFMVSPIAGLRGLGDDAAPVDPAAAPAAPLPAPSTGRLVVSFLLLGGIGYLSYQVGAAISPSAAKRSTWGWIGVPAGILTGPIGLGVMALVSNYQRNS